MTFNWAFDLGSVVTLVLAGIGALAGYVTLRAKVLELAGRADASDKRVEAYGIALADLRLHVSDHCVKKDDLEKVEDRIGKRLDTVEHTIRNSSQTILAYLSGRPSRGRAGGSDE